MGRKRYGYLFLADGAEPVVDVEAVVRDTVEREHRREHALVDVGQRVPVAVGHHRDGLRQRPEGPYGDPAGHGVRPEEAVRVVVVAPQDGLDRLVVRLVGGGGRAGAGVGGVGGCPAPAWVAAGIVPLRSEAWTAKGR